MESFMLLKGVIFVNNVHPYQPIFECLPINDELAGLANKVNLPSLKRLLKNKAISSILLSNFVN